MEKLNVAIADDNERVVSLLEHIVSQDKDLQVVGKAGDGEASLLINPGKGAGCSFAGYYYAESRRPDSDTGKDETRIPPSVIIRLFVISAVGAGEDYRKCL